MLITLSVPFNGAHQLGMLLCESLPDAADLHLGGSGYFINPSCPKRTIIPRLNAIDYLHVVEEEPSLIL